MNVGCDRCGPTAGCTCEEIALPIVHPSPSAFVGTAAVNPTERLVEQVDQPTHYQGTGGLEAIDVIESFGLGFCLGNAIKYILRAGKKRDALTDLKKARWYLDRAIKQAEATP